MSYLSFLFMSVSLDILSLIHTNIHTYIHTVFISSFTFLVWKYVLTHSIKLNKIIHAPGIPQQVLLQYLLLPPLRVPPLPLHHHLPLQLLGRPNVQHISTQYKQFV